MDTPFPFGLPSATAGYLLLYVITLVIHVVFMNYVLAGTGYLAFVAVFSGGPTAWRQRTPMAVILRDWMPFAFGAAITAGVAPLLFVQVLYKKAFYTANLLLHHRWMAVLPLLIVAFYLLYLMKSRWITQWRPSIHMLLGVAAFLCFAFTGYTWTENHMLSLDEQVWPVLYDSGSMFYRNLELLPRFAVWLFGAIPTMCILVAWQLRSTERQGNVVPHLEVRRLGLLSISGLALSMLSGGWYYAWMGEATRNHVTGSMAAAFLIAAVVGMGLQAIGWLTLLRGGGAFAARWIWLASVGLIATLVGATVVREAIRLASVDIAALYDKHAQAAGVGGFPVFIAFLLLNACLIAWCIRLVRRGRVIRAQHHHDPV